MTSQTIGWRRGNAVAALAIAAVVVAACGGGSGGSAYSSSGSTPSSQSTVAGASAASTAIAAAPATATQASGATGHATVNVATSGDKRFVDANGMSLYVFQKDSAGSGKSACSNGCATAWPPLPLPAGATPTAGDGVDGLGVITRDDGTTQVTYDGLPLYRFASDKVPGDENGKSIPNWALATP